MYYYGVRVQQYKKSRMDRERDVYRHAIPGTWYICFIIQRIIASESYIECWLNSTLNTTLCCSTQLLSTPLLSTFWLMHIIMHNAACCCCCHVTRVTLIDAFPEVVCVCMFVCDAGFHSDSREKHRQQTETDDRWRHFQLLYCTRMQCHARGGCVI